MKNDNKLILSISFCFHDSCITLANEEKVLIHLEAERIFREKHKKFKNTAEVDYLVDIGLKYIGKTIDDVTEVLVTEWQNLYNGTKACILGKEFNVILTNHHENHIGVVLPKKFDKCVIFISDGGSEEGTTKVYYKEDNKIWLAEDLNNSNCTGQFYGTMSQLVLEPDFDRAHTSAVGKFMGLSSLGKYDENVMKTIKENEKKLNRLYVDGCKHLLKLFNLKDYYDKAWEDENKQNIAYTAHNYFVDTNVEKLRKHNKFSRNICMSGGCSLNISLNSKIIDDKIFDNVYVSPISTDGGQSLGAILYRYPNIEVEYPFLGRGKEEIKSYDENVIEDLLNHKVIAWFQGRSEIGARALGHRSFIGLPDSVEMRVKISEKIKKREPYRPVAAMIPEEYISEYFEQKYSSPYMTFCAKAKEITKEKAPAIVHFDGTTRVQTVRKTDNPIIYDILLKLKEKGKVPILMNTSFNVASEPIVDTPEDAINTYKLSGADELYIDGVKYSK